MVKIYRQYSRVYQLPNGHFILATRKVEGGRLSPKGGATTVRIQVASATLAEGVAYCHPSDSFNKVYGYCLAFVRAYDKLVETSNTGLEGDADSMAITDIRSRAIAFLEKDYNTAVAVVRGLPTTNGADYGNSDLGPVVRWLKKVGLNQAPYNEAAMFRCIVGEVLEVMGVENHDEVGKQLWELARTSQKQAIDKSTAAGELADIIVFAVDMICRLGCVPNRTLDKVVRKINSRQGRFDPATGKWLKQEVLIPIKEV